MSRGNLSKIYSSKGINTGLQNGHECDLLAIFEKYRPKLGVQSPNVPDWVYKDCLAPNDATYRNRFGTKLPELAWYSNDSRDYVFDTSYNLDKDGFDHLIERAKERAGFSPNTPDKIVRDYLRGVLENLVPKIRRNYKVAIPVYYVQEKKMQLLLPFMAMNGSVSGVFYK